MGGNGAGLQTDDPTVGDVAAWALTGSPTVSGKTNKKSTLVLGVSVDSKSKTEHYGQPDQRQLRRPPSPGGADPKGCCQGF